MMTAENHDDGDIEESGHSPDAVAAIFKMVAAHKPPKRGGQDELAWRVRRHLKACHADLLGSLATAKKNAGRRPRTRRERQRREEAQKLLERFNPEGLKGVELDQLLWEAIYDDPITLIKTFVRDRRAADDFCRQVMTNLRLVMAIAKKFSWAKRMPLGDRIEHGIIGLIRAIARFEPERGNRLSTQAGFWIRNAIKRAIQDEGATIRIPSQLHNVMYQARNAAHALSRRLDRAPTRLEIAGYIVNAKTVGKRLNRKASEKDVERSRDNLAETLGELSAVAKEPASLDAKVSEEGGQTFIDLIEDTGPLAADPLTNLMAKSERELLDKALCRLDPRERRIIRLLFGMDRAGEERTLHEVGRMYGLSRERVRQIQNRALEKMKGIITRLEAP